MNFHKIHQTGKHENLCLMRTTHPTFILALSARFLGRTMLYLASSEGGGLTARDQALPLPPGKPGVIMEEAEAPKLLRMVPPLLPFWGWCWWKPFEWWWRIPFPLPFPLKYGLWLPLPRKVPYDRGQQPSRTDV